MGEATVLIVNPNSQNGELGRQWSYLSKIIRRELAYHEVRTKGPGDATKLAREAILAGAEQVIAIGGDGTVNEVVNGFFENGKCIATDTAMGLLPFGTGGDFRKTVHIPKDPSRAARIIAEGKTRPIDIGHVEYATPSGGTENRVFANIASFGVSGMVARMVNEKIDTPLGEISTNTTVIIY